MAGTLDLPVRASYELIGRLEGDDPTEVGGQVVAQLNVQGTSTVAATNDLRGRRSVTTPPSATRDRDRTAKARCWPITCGDRALAIDGRHEAVVGRDRGPVLGQCPDEALESVQHGGVPLTFEANRKLADHRPDLGRGAAKTPETVGGQHLGTGIKLSSSLRTLCHWATASSSARSGPRDRCDRPARQYRPAGADITDLARIAAEQVGQVVGRMAGRCQGRDLIGSYRDLGTVAERQAFVGKGQVLPLGST